MDLPDLWEVSSLNYNELFQSGQLIQVDRFISLLIYPSDLQRNVAEALNGRKCFNNIFEEGASQELVVDAIFDNCIQFLVPYLNNFNKVKDQRLSDFPPFFNLDGDGYFVPVALQYIQICDQVVSLNSNPIDMGLVLPQFPNQGQIVNEKKPEPSW